MRIATTILLLVCAITSGTAQNYTELCRMAEECFENKEYKKAAEYFTKANSAAKNSKEQLYTLANCGYAWRLAGENKKAADSYRKAIAIDSTQLGLYLQCGNALLETDSVKAAISCYNKIIEKIPDNRDVLFFRAYAYTKSGDFHNAKNDYINLLGNNPNDNEARLGLAILYQKEGSINEALMMLEALIEEQPDNSEYYVARCNIELEQKQYELALMDIDKAIEQSPNNPDYHFTRAEILKQLGKSSAARNSIIEAQKLMKEIK